MNKTLKRYQNANFRNVLDQINCIKSVLKSKTNIIKKTKNKKKYSQDSTEKSNTKYIPDSSVFELLRLELQLPKE